MGRKNAKSLAKRSFWERKHGETDVAYHEYTEESTNSVDDTEISEIVIGLMTASVRWTQKSHRG